MMLRYSPISILLYCTQFSLSFATNDNEDYSNPNDDSSNVLGASGDEEIEGPLVTALTPDTTALGDMIDSENNVISGNSIESGISNDSEGDSSVPLPIIIVFVFLFTMLGVICIQQLQRMFAENKEYNNIKYDIRENRPSLRSGKSYGTVNNYNNSSKSNKQSDSNDNSKNNSKNKTKNGKKSKRNNKTNNNLENNTVVNMPEMEGNSDDSIELGSGYESNVNNNNNNNGNIENMNDLSDLNDSNVKTKGEKLKKQMLVATQGLKDKIGQKLSHVGGNNSLTSKKSKYKGYGSLKQETNENESEEDVCNQNSQNKNNSKQRESNLCESDDSDVKHPGYTMNYGYTEDYDCDFEDSDTQLSEEGDDKPADINETVLKRVILE